MFTHSAKFEFMKLSALNRQTDRQTDGQTDRQTDGQIDLKKATAQRADALKKEKELYYVTAFYEF